MDQSRAINSLAPFIALAKSANSPRAAADLVTQATSAANTYVFAELLQQPNIQALAGAEQYHGFLALLRIFAWGTWESYKSSSNLPLLSDVQAKKLRLLSLLTIASEKKTSSSSPSNLSYSSLRRRLDLSSSIELEHLITEAIYHDLVVATLNPAHQTVVITSVAPLRDLAPGSVQGMIGELTAWSARCQSVLVDLEAEIQKVKSEAEKRAKREALAERQIKAVTESAEKTGAGGGASGSLNSRGHGQRSRRDPADELEDDEDAMDVDGGSLSGPGKKKGGSVFSSRASGRGSR